MPCVAADKATRGNLLFDMLLTPARLAIFNSMTPLHVEAGTDIIQQGQLNATKFYVLEKGNCDVFVSNEGSHFKPVKVLSYGSCRWDACSLLCAWFCTAAML